MTIMPRPDRAALFRSVRAQSRTSFERSREAAPKEVSTTLDQGSRLRSNRTGFLVLFSALALAACGKQQQLKPAVGSALPPKPATSPMQPTPAQLLTPGQTYRPGRSDELLTKSQTRPDDKFDLPPS